VPQVEGMLAEAVRARAAGADVVIASVRCCTEYESDPGPTQTAIAGTLLASPDVDLVLGHHAHVVQPFERINGKWVAYGLGKPHRRTGPAGHLRLGDRPLHLHPRS
jgi:poly-gamma-glutamate capsule biosynthesis protein CapA/YwtB (metallophosphatase superfamily)